MGCGGSDSGIARFPRSLPASVGALGGRDARQSLVALGLNSSTSLVAGAILGSITSTFERYPGLLVLVPAAIGLRGNVFGAFGNRLSTAIHAGTFRLSARRDTILGQNVVASGVLTALLSVVLAVIAKLVSVGLGLDGTISVADLTVVSVAGGLAASVVVLAATVSLTAAAVRRDWDLDNVTAPIVSVLGDVITLPALWLATGLIGVGMLTPLLGLVLAALSVAGAVVATRSPLGELRRIVRESIPILVVAATVSTMAGLALEKRFDTFVLLPALLVLVPAHLSSAGALGGILSGRLSTRIFLGTVEPTAWPGRGARTEMYFVSLLAVPVFLFNGLGADLTANLLGRAGPGLGWMVAASMIAGAIAMVCVAAVAYAAAIAAVRSGVDPDTYGIPVVSSTLDFVGAFTLVLTITALGIVS